MFVFSKLVGIVINPGFWIPALLVLATALLWTRRQRLGRWLLTATVTIVILCTVLPIGQALNEVLEDRFPPVRSLPAHVDGIVVLGGAVNQLTTHYRGQPALNDAAERMTEFVALARRHPEARLVYTGGSGSLFDPDIKETEVARLFFAQMGLDVSRIVFEDRSRNTWENALFTYRLMRPKKGETWVLITSAQHMPRSVGAFRQAGWNPLPYPVDYLTNGWANLTVGLDMVGAFHALWFGLHEWIGLIAYRWLGHSDALFPGPPPTPGAAGDRSG